MFRPINGHHQVMITIADRNNVVENILTSFNLISMKQKLNSRLFLPIIIETYDVEMRHGDTRIFTEMSVLIYHTTRCHIS
jgi:hypothetical protein